MSPLLTRNNNRKKLQPLRPDLYQSYEELHSIKEPNYALDGKLYKPINMSTNILPNIERNQLINSNSETGLERFYRDPNRGGSKFDQIYNLEYEKDKMSRPPVRSGY